MPKLDWDAMLGSFADSGLDAYKAASAATTASREVRRREGMDAFNMGGATPIIRGPVGGLGGMARGQIDAAAGLPPTQEEYNAYNTPGAIGAAPPADAPQGAMGDTESRANVGDTTAQASTQEQQAQDFVSRLDAGRQKMFMQGAEQAEVKRQQQEVGGYLHDLSTPSGPLAKLRDIKVGADAAQKLMDQRQAQIQMVVKAQDALHYERRDASPERQGEIDKLLRSAQEQVNFWAADIEKAQKALENAPEAARMAASEVKRISHSLELLGADPDLIENYHKVYMDGGYISDAGRLLINRIGRGTPTKGPPKGGVGYTKPSRGTARPLK